MGFSHIIGFLNISATASSVACMSPVDISAVSSSSSPPGKVSALSKQTLHNISGSLIH